MTSTLLERSSSPSQKQIQLPKAISADSHTIEPPEAFSRHIDPAFRDRVPKLIHDERKGESYLIEGMPAPVALATVSSCGKRSYFTTDANGKQTFFLDEVGPYFPNGQYTEGQTRVLKRPMATMTFADTPAGGWRAAPRLEAQDRDGVIGEVLYPTFGMVLCNHPDSAYQNACFRAYNRWLQELVSEAPTRLFGIGQTALRSVKEGIADFQRIKEMGFVGVMLPGDPDIEGEWHAPVFDPLWEAAQALDLPVSFHTLASGRNKKDGPSLAYAAKQPGAISFGLEVVRSNQDIISSFLLGGVFDRFPHLKLVCVEAGAGWIPDYINRMDHVYTRHRVSQKIPELPKMPSEYFFENVYVTFQDDPVALSLTAHLNPKRLLWANDYPHSDATWPWSRNLLAEHMKSLSQEERRWILHDNVKALYNLPAA